MNEAVTAARVWGQRTLRKQWHVYPPPKKVKFALAALIIIIIIIIFGGILADVNGVFMGIPLADD